MGKGRALGAASGIALAIAAASAPAAAQDEGAEDERTIVVTGTLIAGSREDAPAPVEVIEAAELAAQGSP